jgi:hypothetical protein
MVSVLGPAHRIGLVSLAAFSVPARGANLMSSALVSQPNFVVHVAFSFQLRDTLPFTSREGRALQGLSEPGNLPPWAEVTRLL